MNNSCCRSCTSKTHVLSVNESGSKSAKAASMPTGSGQENKLSNLVIFSRQFATMIDAGIAIVRCLDILEDRPGLRPQTVIAQCKKDVKGGLSLTDAFSKTTTSSRGFM